MMEPLAAKTDSAMAQDASIVNYQHNEEIFNSECQVLWSNIMDEGQYKNPSTYEKIEALLLCWEPAHDDLAIGDEVNRFRSLLVDKFNYNAHIEKIGSRAPKKLQVQVNSRVAKYIEDHDGPKTLIIVYYAGHGKPGDQYGHLQLFGQTSPNDTESTARKHRNCLVWNNTERILKDAEADVLQIFDCCYAGNMDLTRGDQKMEYLAATGHMGKTAVPGKTSFTSALIFAMEALLEEKGQGRFTTVDLLKKIKDDAPHFPKKSQTPLLSNRNTGDTSTSRIMLHPLSKDGSRAETPTKDAARSDPAKRRTLTLHLDFNDIPSKEDIRTLGRELNNINETRALGVNRVHWGGMQSKVAQAWADLLKSIERQKQRRRTLSNSGYPETWLNANELIGMPPTPSSTLQHTPQKQEPADWGKSVSELSGMDTASGEQSQGDESNAESESPIPSRRKRPRLSLTPA